MGLNFKLTGKPKLDVDAIGKKMMIAEFKKRAPEIDQYLHLITWGKEGSKLYANLERIPEDIASKIKA